MDQAPSEGVDKAVRLFTFLREVAQLRTSIVRDLSAYEAILWIDQIPKEPECQCIAWQPNEIADDAVPWIEVRKPRLTEPPAPPENLADWIDTAQLKNSSQPSPHIFDRIAVKADSARGVGAEADDPIVEKAATAFVELRDHPEVQAQCKQYIESSWTPWAEDDRRKQPIHRIYTKLFYLYQQQKDFGESKELVLGFGQLRWKLASGQSVNRHLVTVRVSMEFDPVRGIITVQSASDGACPQFEQDMLEPGERPAPDIQVRLERQAADLEGDLWKGEGLCSLLKAAAHSLGEGSGVFTESLAPTESAGSAASVGFAPALILRNRTERGFLQLYGRIIEDLRKRGDVPPGLRPLIEIGCPEHELDDTSLADPATREAPSNACIDELLFPLPSNDEQREIVSRLWQQKGVVVQGPPGTGKSHTIANLVCQLLSQGKRVLVTSHTERALRVLKDKIPKAITDLCVVLLGHDRLAMDGLQSSIKKITERLNRWDEASQSKTVKKLAETLFNLKRRGAELDSELRAIRESDTHRHPPIPGGYSGTLQQIAAQLRAPRDSLLWIEEFVHPENTCAIALPVSDEEAVKLLSQVRKLCPQREAELRKRFPPGLPQQPALPVLHPDKMKQLVGAEAAAKREIDQLSAEQPRTDEGDALSGPSDGLRELEVSLSELLSQNAELQAQEPPWIQQMVKDVRSGQHDPWRVLAEQTRIRLESIHRVTESAAELDVAGCTDLDYSRVRDDTSRLIQHVEAGGKLKRCFWYTAVARKHRYILERIRIGGKPATTLDDLRLLCNWAEMQFQLRALERLWADLIEPPSGAIARRLAAYRNLCEPLDAAAELHESIEHAKLLIKGIPGMSAPAWHDEPQVKLFKNRVRLALVRDELRTCGAALSAVAQTLSSMADKPDAHPVTARLAEAVGSRNCEDYYAAYEQIEGLWADLQELAIRDALLTGLREVMPELADALIADRNAGHWGSRLASLNRAWNWHLADKWLSRQLDPRRFGYLQEQRRALQAEIQNATAQLAAEKAWNACMRRMTPWEETHLKGWMQAIRRIGAGTGKRAIRFRRVAREHLDNCRSAVPAWIMPIHRVVESVTPGKDAFDVLIIDEASQSGIEAMFLHYLAPKIIIVGDDKQIAPYNVGVNRDDVELLRRRHIADLPFSDHIDLEHSLFDQGSRMFSRSIRLREHFRCMPEIIQFSNGLCYQDEPLIPLRQYGENRLLPVIVTKHVPDGLMEGKSPNVVNPAEADALVAQIEQCCRASEYDGKTFGVISLLGGKQAKLIEEKLRETIGPEEIERRRIVCGDAYAFQGDERNVMFLSMVAAVGEGRRIATLTQDNDMRRFNVAASRAQDQMWLFHSVTQDDLSPQCLRRRLLDYCLHPGTEPDADEQIVLADLQRTAALADRNRDEPPAPFDSWFEVDVFLKIRTRGYRVKPQYELAGCRIDLVVFGMNGRLAVECDGERWHGSEQYEADMIRQRKLERCGLRFLRIRGGAFYRDPGAATEPLWELLNDLGIRPGGKNDESEIPIATVADAKAQLTLSAVSTDPNGSAATNARASTRPSTSVALTSRVVDRPNVGHNPTRHEDGLFEAQSHDCGLPDPRTASLAEVRKALVEIVRDHGPMPCHYAHELYLQRVGGIERAGKTLRQVLNKALTSAVKNGLVEQQNEYNSKDPLSRIVRAAGTAAAVVRPRGTRKLEDIPPSEIAAVMDQLSAQSATGLDRTKETLFRAVLDHYGLSRLTRRATEILDTAWAMAQFTP